jgi:hypothetical protein
MPEPTADAPLPEPADAATDADAAAYSQEEPTTAAGSVLREAPSAAYSSDADAKPDTVAELDAHGKWNEAVGDAADCLEDEAARRRESSSRSRALLTGCAAFLGLLVAGAASAYMMYERPSNLDCGVHQLHAQRFKVDVTEFWEPRISASLQLVLSVRNTNLLREMALEECHVRVYEESTGLLLGSATHGALVVSKLTNNQVNLPVRQLGAAVPQPQQRRLAEAFLRHKALLLTIVATATSRLPLKGSRMGKVTTNVSRRLDLKVMAKDPWYVRPPPPPPKPPPETTDVF